MMVMLLLLCYVMSCHVTLSIYLQHIEAFDGIDNFGGFDSVDGFAGNGIGFGWNEFGWIDFAGIGLGWNEMKWNDTKRNDAFHMVLEIEYIIPSIASIHTTKFILEIFTSTTAYDYLMVTTTKTKIILFTLSPRLTNLVFTLPPWFFIIHSSSKSVLYYTHQEGKRE